jgi:NAD(P) transhydrogenase
MQQIPQRMVVIGGGVIGCEYASIFAALGVKVTIVNQRERLLMQLDGEVTGATPFEARLLPGALSVLVGPGFKAHHG